MAVVTFSNIKGGGGSGAPSGITFLNSDYTLEFIESAVTEAVDSALTAYTRTEDFATINGSAITSGDNLIIEGTPYSGGTGIGVENHIISVTGDYETVVELTQAEYDALTAYSENTTYIITDAPSINMSAYTPTSGFSTINGSAITSGGNLTIEEVPYSAGTNINISDHVISVTGITVPTKLSDLQNDEGFITSADTQNFVTSGDVKTQIEGYNYINSGDAQTQIENSISGKVDTSALTEYYTSAETNTAIENAVSGLASETYVNNAVSGKMDTSGMTAYWTSAETESAITAATDDMATQTWVGQQGYLTGYTETDPVFQSSPASGISAQDILDWDAKLDSSDLIPYYTSAETDTAISNAVSGLATEQYVDNSVSGKVDTSAMTQYYTSAQTDTAISNAVSGKVDTDTLSAYSTTVEVEGMISGFTTSGDVKTQIEGYNYINSGDAQTQIENSISGKADADTFTAYTPTSGFATINGSAITEGGSLVISGGSEYSAGTNINIDENNVISVTGITEQIQDIEDHLDDVEEVTASALTELHNTKQDLLVSGTNIKTINNESILGSGNIVISGGSGSVVDYNPLQIEFSPEYSYINYYELVFNGSVRQFAGRVAFDTINGYTIFHSSDNDKVNWTIPTTGDIQTQINNSVSGKADTSALTQYYTSAQTDTAISNATSGLQETLVSGTNIKTINNESLLGSGNIVIQGGSGGTNIIELTQAEYDALTAYTEDAMYVITDAQEINMDNYATTGDLGSYYTSAQTDTAISNAVSGKTDKVSVTANTRRQFPRWNSQGVVTGTTGNTVYERNFSVNGTSKTMLQTTNSDLPSIYAPTTAGTAGQPLLSNGSGAPVWGSYKFQFISQSAYDAITTKDSTTIYFIISEN